jgi:hypothetical protein
MPDMPEDIDRAASPESDPPGGHGSPKPAGPDESDPLIEILSSFSREAGEANPRIPFARRNARLPGGSRCNAGN